MNAGASVTTAIFPVAGLVEKPAPGDAPSSLASIGRYVPHPEVFDTLAALGPGRGGEIQLADAIDALARHGEHGAAFRGLMAAELAAGERGD